MLYLLPLLLTFTSVCGYDVRDAATSNTQLLAEHVHLLASAPASMRNEATVSFTELAKDVAAIAATLEHELHPSIHILVHRVLSWYAALTPARITQWHRHNVQLRREELDAITRKIKLLSKLNLDSASHESLKHITAATNRIRRWLDPTAFPRASFFTRGFTASSEPVGPSRTLARVGMVAAMVALGSALYFTLFKDDDSVDTAIRTSQSLLDVLGDEATPSQLNNVAGKVAIQGLGLEPGEEGMAEVKQQYAHAIQELIRLPICEGHEMPNFEVATLIKTARRGGDLSLTEQQSLLQWLVAHSDVSAFEGRIPLVTKITRPAGIAAVRTAHETFTASEETRNQRALEATHAMITEKTGYELAEGELTLTNLTRLAANITLSDHIPHTLAPSAVEAYYRKQKEVVAARDRLNFDAVVWDAFAGELSGVTTQTEMEARIAEYQATYEIGNIADLPTYMRKIIMYSPDRRREDQSRRVLGFLALRSCARITGATPPCRTRQLGPRPSASLAHLSPETLIDTAAERPAAPPSPPRPPRPSLPPIAAVPPSLQNLIATVGTPPGSPKTPPIPVGGPSESGSGSSW